MSETASQFPFPLQSDFWRKPLRIIGLMLLSALLFLPVLLAWTLGFYRLRMALVQAYYGAVCAVLGIRVRRSGAVPAPRPCLLLTNHTSYLDIPVIGSSLPVSFTPKKEIASWPIIGLFSRMADCVFVERQRGKMAEAQANMLAKLDAGRRLCLFPEGTTSNGIALKPFKSGFLQLAELRPTLAIQTGVLAYVRVNGQPLHESQREQVGWFGEASLLPHLWRLLGFQSIEVELVLHPPVTMTQFESRKELSHHAEQRIAATLAERIAHAKPAD